MSEDTNFTQGPPPERASMGRPMTELDPKLIEEFLMVGMQVKKIANYFNCTPQTLYNRFGTLIAHCNTLYDFEILQKQKELADAGDRHMLVHLGKTRLQQSEAAPVEVEPDAEDKSLTWEVEVLTVAKPTSLTESERAELEGEDED